MEAESLGQQQSESGFYSYVDMLNLEQVCSLSGSISLCSINEYLSVAPFHSVLLMSTYP